jgi:hypothetical protein
MVKQYKIGKILKVSLNANTPVRYHRKTCTIKAHLGIVMVKDEITGNFNPIYKYAVKIYDRLELLEVLHTDLEKVKLTVRGKFIT